MVLLCLLHTTSYVGGRGAMCSMWCRWSLQLVEIPAGSVCVGSVQSRGFGLEGTKVGTCGSSSALPASTQGQNICSGGSLAVPAFAKHPFGCAGANSRARILLQLLRSTEQLKENREKPQNKASLGIAWKHSHISCLLLLSLDLHRDFDCWPYCLFIRWIPQDSPVQ